MSVVGRAYVTVRAVTRQVEGDIQDGVDKALGRVDEKMSKEGESSGKKLGEGVGEGVSKSKIDEKISESVKKYDDRHASNDGNRIGNAFGKAIGDSLLHDNNIVDKFQNVSKKLLNISEPEGEKSGKGWGKKFAVGVGKSLMNPMVLLGVAAPSAITQAGTLVSDALASTISLASSLGPAVAASAAVGGSAVMGLLTTIGTVKLAFSKFAQGEELDQLKSSMGPIKDYWQGTAEDIQKTLFPALEGASRRITLALGPTLRQGMVETAGSVGGLTEDLTRLTENPAFQDRFGRILSNNADAMGRFGSAGVHALAAAVDVGAASTGLVTRLSQATNGLATNMARQLAVAERSGKLEAWFNHAGSVTAQWGRILGDTGKTLYNVFHAGTTESGKLLDMLEGVTQGWSDFTSSIGGQNRLKKWFADSTPVMHAFGGVIASLGRGLADLSGDGDGLTRTLNVIADDAIPGLVKVINAFSTESSALLGAVLPAIGDLATGITPEIADFAGAVGDNLGPALHDVVPVLDDLISAALEVGKDFLPLVGVVGALARAIEPVAHFVDLAAQGFDQLPGSIKDTITTVVTLRIALGALSKSGKLDALVSNVGSAVGKIRASIAGAQGGFGKLRAGLGGVTGLLGGPWGLALGLGATALGAFTAKQQAAKAHIDELSQSLDQQTGSITKNTRQIVINALQQKGVYDDAKALGINIGLVTEATLGQKDAIYDLNTQLAAMRIASVSTTGADTARIQRINDLAAAALGERNNLDKSTESVRLKAQAEKEAARYSKLHGDAILTAKTRMSAASKVDDQLARAAGRTAGATDKQRIATQKLTQATLVYHDATIKLIGGNIAFEQAIADASKEIAKGKKTLDIHTQAGRDNMTALLDLAQAAGTVTGSAQHQQDALERARQKIIDFARASGDTKEEAQKLADRLITLNKNLDETGKKHPKPTVDVGGIDSALYKLGQIEHYKIHDKVFNVKPTVGSVGGEYSGIVPGKGRYASGGYTGDGALNDVAGTVHRREFVVNAEATDRHRDLLEALNAGARVRAGDAGIGGGQLVINIHNPVPERASQSVSSVLRNEAVNSGWVR